MGRLEGCGPGDFVHLARAMIVPSTRGTPADSNSQIIHTVPCMDEAQMRPSPFRQ